MAIARDTNTDNKEAKQKPKSIIWDLIDRIMGETSFLTDSMLELENKLLPVSDVTRDKMPGDTEPPNEHNSPLGNSLNEHLQDLYTIKERVRDIISRLEI